MKKIFSILAMAAVVLCMASCAFGGSDRYKDGKAQPDIDYENSKINGMYYDSETLRCWAVVVTYHEKSLKIEKKYHYWDTHFNVVEAYEWYMYDLAHQGDFSATYGLSVTNYGEGECAEQEDYAGNTYPWLR